VKNTILAATLVAIMITGSFAGTKKISKSDDPKNAIKINPLSLFIATGNLAYERNIAKRINVQLGLYFTAAKIGNLTYSGIGIDPSVRFYLSGGEKIMQGFYIAPGLRYRNVTLSNEVSQYGMSYDNKFT